MPTQFDISRFGAIADDTTVNTAAIQAAIDACHSAGGGQVWCGPGRFRTGALQLKSGVELHLATGCRIVGSTDLADYSPLVADGFHADRAPEASSESLLWAVDAEDIAITGNGTIDGSGLAFYEDTDGISKLAKPPTPRPRIAMLYRCRRVRIMDTAFVDCPCWTLWLMRCEGVTIQRITITGNRRMRNMDGIDIDSCRDVTMSDCRLDTEDDCIVVRAVQHVYAEPAICENVVITNCVLRSACQGVRVGCPSDGTIRNCTFTNLVIQSTNNGIVFENPKRYLRPESVGTADMTNILFSNIVIDCKRSPISIRVEDGITLRAVADIRFSDMQIRSGGPCVIQGSPETPIRDISFANMRIQTTGPDAIIARHCTGLRLSNVELSNIPDKA